MTTRPNIAQAIGALTAEIEALTSRLDRDHDDRKSVDEAASRSRDQVRKTLAELTKEHADLIRRMDKVEPVADMVTGFKAKAVGAMFVLGMIGSAVLGFLAYFKTQLSHILWGG